MLVEKERFVVNLKKEMRFFKLVGFVEKVVFIFINVKFLKLNSKRKI